VDPEGLLVSGLLVSHHPFDTLGIRCGRTSVRSSLLPLSGLSILCVFGISIDDAGKVTISMDSYPTYWVDAMDMASGSHDLVLESVLHRYGQWQQLGRTDVQRKEGAGCLSRAMDLWAGRTGGNGNSGKLGQVTALVNTGVSARRRLLQLAGYSSGRSDYEMARE